jgi:hypothetical protein
LEKRSKCKINEDYLKKTFARYRSWIFKNTGVLPRVAITISWILKKITKTYQNGKKKISNSIQPARAKNDSYLEGLKRSGVP